MQQTYRDINEDPNRSVNSCSLSSTSAIAGWRQLTDVAFLFSIVRIISSTMILGDYVLSSVLAEPFSSADLHTWGVGRYPHIHLAAAGYMPEQGLD